MRFLSTLPAGGAFFLYDLTLLFTEDCFAFGGHGVNNLINNLLGHWQRYPDWCIIEPVFAFFISRLSHLRISGNFVLITHRYFYVV
jgi:hypothetical protein